MSAAYSRCVPEVDVLHLCFGGLGGHRTVVSTLATALGQRGLSTGVIAVAPPQDLITDLAAWRGVAELEAVEVRRRADVSSMGGVFRAARRLPGRGLIIHSARHAMPAIAGLRSVGATGPVVIREGHSRAVASPQLRAQSVVAMGLADAAVFLTREDSEAFPLGRWPLRALRRRRIIPNGIALPPEPAPRAGGAVPVLGMAGRLVPGKDLGTVIRALALLKHRGQAARLVVAGDGPDRAEWTALAEELGVADDVSFLGTLPEATMGAWFAGLDVYVHATDGEGFSNALLGAAAAGLPIVASDVAGVHDMLSDASNASLVTPRDPIAFAEAVEHLIADPDAAGAMGSAARALVVQRYSADHMADAYLELLAELDASGPWWSARRPRATTT